MYEIAHYKTTVEKVMFFGLHIFIDLDAQNRKIIFIKIRP